MSYPWFGVKIYGIGIGPKNFAGWVSTILYCILMVAVPVTTQFLNWSAWMIPVAYVLFTVGFFTLLFVKGDGKPWRWRWRWRWGRD